MTSGMRSRHAAHTFLSGYTSPYTGVKQLSFAPTSMTPPAAPESTSLPAADPKRSQGSKASQAADVASTVLDNALQVLEALGEVTEKVPYLSVVTGCISKLIQIRNTMKAHEERASALIENIGEVIKAIAEGLKDIDDVQRTVAATSLRSDLESFGRFLHEVCAILEKWTSQHFAKRLWKRGDFPNIADGLDRKVAAFKLAFDVRRISALSTGQAVLDSKIQVLFDKNIREELHKWLNPVNGDQSHRTAAQKRHPGTGNWLLRDHAEFQEWIYSPTSFFWLHGISGSGKTVLSSAIINDIRTRAETYAYFYFETTNLMQRTVTQLLCSLVMQLSAQVPNPDRTLYALWESYSKGRHVPTDSQLISEALIPLLRELTSSIYLVLDALDECSDREDLLEVISKILDSNLSSLHILVTSRPEVHYNTDIAKHGVLISLEGHIDQDIESYVDGLISKARWIRSNGEEIKKGLLERSGGMFRLVALQLGELRKCNGSKAAIKKALMNMPTSLFDFYDRILENVRDTSMVTHVGRTLMWLIFSEEDLTLNAIIDALAFDFEEEPLCFSEDERMDSQALLDACAGLISLSEDIYNGGQAVVKIAHASVKDYFLSNSGPSKFTSSCETTERAAHYLITRTCLAYLRDLNSAEVKRFPLAKYAANHWDYHARRFHEVDQGPHPASRSSIYNDKTLHPVLSWNKLIKTIVNLLQPQSPQYIMLRKLRSGGYPLWTNNAYPPIYLAVGSNIYDLVNRLLDMGTQVDECGGYLGNALQVAAYQGNLDMVCLLLERGADVNMQGGYYGTALQAAADGGNLDLVRLLLEHSADVNMQGGEYGTALQAAADGGNLDLIRLLLEHGANVYDSIYR